MGARSIDHESIFSRVYQLDVWGGSGTGSTERSTRLYRRALRRLLKDHGVKRVVDLGCGDWSFSRLIDWGGVEYLGVDVVESLIRRNRREYGCDNIRFRQMDLRRGILPAAELYLLKDVLQHWTGEEIGAFLRRMSGRRMLITNSIARGAYRELSRAGGYRPVDILRSPFSVPGRPVLRYGVGPGDLKAVILVGPEWPAPARARPRR